MAFGHLVKEPGFFRQLFYSLLGSIGGVNVGSYFSYVAVALPSFERDPEAPFELTEDHKAMITGVHCLGAILGSFLSAPLAPRFGRKTIILCSQFPIIVGWAMFALASDFAVILAAAILMGIFYGLVLPVGQLYLVEISSPKARGFIAGTSVLSVVFYNLVNYSLGTVVKWRWLALANGGIHLAYVGLGAFAPESPAWLLAVGQRGRAQKSLEMLGRSQAAKTNVHFLSSTDRTERQDLKTTSRVESSGPDKVQQVDIIPLEVAYIAEDVVEKPASFAEIFHPANLRRILLITVFIVLRQFTGAFAVVAYTVDIFQTADGAVDPNVGAVVVGAVQLVFVLLTNIVTDKVGRKRLLAGSGVVTGLAQCVFGVYFFLRRRDDDDASRELAETALSWVPLATLVTFVAGFSLGIAAALYVFIVELIPFRIRNLVSGWAVAVNSLANFFVVALYFKMKHGLTEAGTFWLYGGACFALAVYCALVLPETKGTVLEDADRQPKQLSDARRGGNSAGSLSFGNHPTPERGSITVPCCREEEVRVVDDRERTTEKEEAERLLTSNQNVS